MKNKKIITATLLVSDGPVQNSYFEELLEIDGNKLFKLFDEINNDLTNLGFGFYLRVDSTKSDLVTVNDILDEAAVAVPDTLLVDVFVFLTNILFLSKSDLTTIIVTELAVTVSPIVKSVAEPPYVSVS